MEINIFITEDAFKSMTWNDMVAIQSAGKGNVDYAALQKLVLPFIVDKDNKPLPAEDARRLLGELNVFQISELLERVAASIHTFLSQKQNGNSVSSG